MRNDAQDLTPEQRNRVRRIGFWILFAYVQVWWLELAAPVLVVVSLGLLAATYLPAVRSIVMRPHIVALNVAIVAAMAFHLLVRPRLALALDAAMVVAALALTLRSRNLRWPVLLGSLHAAALFWNPWCSIGMMKLAPETAAHGFARMFAAGLAAAIVVREVVLRKTPPAPVVPVSPSRPLTVAEWEAQNAGD